MFDLARKNNFERHLNRISKICIPGPIFLNRLVRLLGVGLGRLIAVEEHGSHDQGSSKNKLEAENEAEEENWNENETEFNS